jgi:hypothetical protein
VEYAPPRKEAPDPLFGVKWGKDKKTDNNLHFSLTRTVRPVTILALSAVVRDQKCNTAGFGELLE